MASGALAIAVALGCFGARSPDPRLAEPSGAAAQAARIAAAGVAADAALAALDATLAASVVEARAGGAAALAGAELPDEHFDAAARALEGADPQIAAVTTALRYLAALVAEAATPLSVPDATLSVSDARQLAAELRAAGSTAAAISALRHAADDVVAALGDAFAAADEPDPAGIDEAIARARDRLPLVERWAEALPTLAVWTAAVGELLDSLGVLSAATRAGDPLALAAAVRAYHAAAEGADRADRGLAIALADAGGAIAGGAPATLAAERAEVAARRADVASVVLNSAAEGSSDST